MANEDNKQRYSPKELAEFEELILGKLEKAKKELNYIKETLSKNTDHGTDSTSAYTKIIRFSFQNTIENYSHSFAGVGRVVFHKLFISEQLSH